MNMITKTDDFIKRVESTAEEDFFTPRTFYHLSSSMFHEMCDMLKEQEAVEPKKTAYQRVDNIIAYRYRCGMCDMSIFPSYKYCPFCGQAVKWE